MLRHQNLFTIYPMNYFIKYLFIYFYSLLVLEFWLSLCAIFDQFKKLRTCFKDEKEEHVGSTFSSSKVIYAISFFFSNNILSFTASRTYIYRVRWMTLPFLRRMCSSLTSKKKYLRRYNEAIKLIRINRI